MPFHFKDKLEVFVCLIHLLYCANMRAAAGKKTNPQLFQKLTQFIIPVYFSWMSSQWTLDAISVTQLLTAVEKIII